MKTKALWQAKIAELLLGGMPFHIAGPLVGKEFGVKVSKNLLSRIWNEVCAPALILRRRAVKTSEAIVREAAACPDSSTPLQLLAATASYRPREEGRGCEVNRLAAELVPWRKDTVKTPVDQFVFEAVVECKLKDGTEEGLAREILWTYAAKDRLRARRFLIEARLLYLKLARLMEKGEQTDVDLPSVQTVGLLVYAGWKPFGPIVDILVASYKTTARKNPKILRNWASLFYRMEGFIRSQWPERSEFLN